MGNSEFKSDVTEPPIDVGALIRAAAFHNLPLPPGFEERYGAEIARARDAVADISNHSSAKNKADNDDETPEERKLQRLRDAFNNTVEQARREREWLTSPQTYAGRAMTGEEWQIMSTWFRDLGNREAWEAAMMAKTGKTLEEVRETGGKMDRFFELMDGDRKGELSAADQAEFDRLGADEDVRRGIETYEELSSPKGPAAERSMDSALADRASLLASSSSALEDDTVREPLTAASARSELPPSPNLREAYQAATSPDVQTSTTPPPLLDQRHVVHVSPDNMFN